MHVSPKSGLSFEALGGLWCLGKVSALSDRGPSLVLGNLLCSDTIPCHFYTGWAWGPRGLDGGACGHVFSCVFFFSWIYICCRKNVGTFWVISDPTSKIRPSKIDQSFTFWLRSWRPSLPNLELIVLAMDIENSVQSESVKSLHSTVFFLTIMLKNVFHGLLLWNFMKVLPCLFFFKCGLIVPSVCQCEEDGGNQLSLCA